MNFSILINNTLLILGLLFSLWVLSVKIKNVSIIDLFWGMGFVILGWAGFLYLGHLSVRGSIVLGAVTLWGCRLSLYLAFRNAGKPEDFRYQAMRVNMGTHFAMVSLFSVFWLQGVILLIVSLPLQLALGSTQDLNAIDLFGLLIFLTGFIFESVGDFQLSRFKSDVANKGKVFDRGLWRYSRHPNYFGDFLVWWGFYLLALGAGYEWSIISPLLMSFLLLKVSGVALLEKSLQKKTEGYNSYYQRTSAFFPMPPHH